MLLTGAFPLCCLSSGRQQALSHPRHRSCLIPNYKAESTIVLTAVYGNSTRLGYTDSLDSDDFGLKIGKHFSQMVDVSRFKVVVHDTEGGKSVPQSTMHTNVQLYTLTQS